MQKKFALFMCGALFLAVLGAWALRLARMERAVKINGTLFRVEVADSASEQTVGLSGRTSLGEDKGMLFVFDTPGRYGFWMKGMKFPIDIIWIHDSRIVGFVENLPPPTYENELPTSYPPGPIDTALEVNAGIVERYGLRVGDTIRLGK